MNKKEIGNKYETLAIQYLISKGYTILEHNYRNKMGEIDILAMDRDTIVAIEVKYRNDMSYGDPLEAVTMAKQRRISRTFLVYYSSHGYSDNTPCRFDVIGIYGTDNIVHIENAFEFVY